MKVIKKITNPSDIVASVFPLDISCIGCTSIIRLELDDVVPRQEKTTDFRGEEYTTTNLYWKCAVCTTQQQLYVNSDKKPLILKALRVAEILKGRTRT